MFLWLKTLYRKRAVTWPFIFYTIIWTLSFGVPQSITILIVTICIFFLCRMEWVHKPLNKILYFNVPEKTDNLVKGNGYFKSFFYDRTLTILDSKNEE